MDSKEKIRRVEIDYGYDSDEWQNIRIQFANGVNANVSREQITTFLRMAKIVEDLQQVQTLRDQLIKIFGATTTLSPAQPSQ